MGDRRRAPRAATGSDPCLDTVLGLIGLHFFLSGGTDFDTFTGEIRGYLSQAATERASWAHTSSDSVRASRTKATVLDQSLGYRLQWPREAGLRIRVGELIGLSIAHEEDDPLWMVGVVRWIRYSVDGSVDAGVELLAPPRSVSLRTLDPLVIRRLPSEESWLTGCESETIRMRCSWLPPVRSIFRRIGWRCRRRLRWTPSIRRPHPCSTTTI